MAARKRTRAQIDRDRARVAELTLMGWTQREIARELNTSQQMVNYDQQAVHAQWRADAQRDFDDHVAQELAAIAKLERAFWQAYERSCADATVTTNEVVDDTIQAPGGKRHVRVASPRRRERVTARTAPGGAGDTSCLLGLLRCHERKAKLLGLDAPTNTNVNVQGQVLSFAELYEIATQQDPSGAPPPLQILQEVREHTPPSSNGGTSGDRGAWDD